MEYKKNGNVKLILELNRKIMVERYNKPVKNNKESNEIYEPVSDVVHILKPSDKVEDTVNSLLNKPPKRKYKMREDF